VTGREVDAQRRREKAWRVFEALAACPARQQHTPASSIQEARCRRGTQRAPCSAAPARAQPQRRYAESRDERRAACNAAATRSVAAEAPSTRTASRHRQRDMRCRRRPAEVLRREYAKQAQIPGTTHYEKLLRAAEAAARRAAASSPEKRSRPSPHGAPAVTEMLARHKAREGSGRVAEVLKDSDVCVLRKARGHAARLPEQCLWQPLRYCQPRSPPLLYTPVAAAAAAAPSFRPAAAARLRLPPRCASRQQALRAKGSRRSTRRRIEAMPASARGGRLYARTGVCRQQPNNAHSKPQLVFFRYAMSVFASGYRETYVQPQGG